MAITAAQLEVKFTSDGAGKVASEMRGLGNEADAAGKKGSAFGRTMQTALGFVGGGLLLAGIGQMSNLGKAFLGAGLDFEQGMANVSAVTGATGAELKQLSDLALQIGKDTSFGANDATMAIEELAKAGVSTKDILNGAADGAVALAAAGGVALPEAAAVMSQALNQFGLSGDQATHVADLLAAASATSATGVSELGASLTYVGTTAAALGIPIEDVITSLAMMADQGLSGSMAGTALNNALMSMANPTEKAQQAMNELGISFFDAQGVMKPMPQILSELATATAGLTQEQRAAYLENIFGVEGARAINALLVSQTEEAKKAGKSWEDYYKSVNQDGAAAEQAAARMNSTMGSIEQLKGSLETLAILGTMMVLPMFRGLIDGATGVVNGVAGFVTSMQSYMSNGESFFTAFSLSARTALYNMFGVDGMNAIMPFVDGALDGLQMLVSGIQSMAGVIGDALGATLGFLGDHLGTIVGVILPAVATFFALTKAIAAFQAISVAAPAAISAIRMGLASMNPYVLAAAAAVALFALAWRNNWFGVQDKVKAGLQALKPVLADAKQGFDKFVSGDWATRAKVLTNGINTLANGVDALGKRFPALAVPLGILSAGLRVLPGLVGSAATQFKSFLDQGMNPVSAGFATLGVGFQKLSDMFPQFSGFFGGMRDQMIGFGAVAMSVGDGVSKLFSGDFKGALQDFGTAASQVWENVGNGAKTLWTGIQELGGAIGDLLGGVDWGSAMSSLGNMALDGLQLAWDSISSIDWGQYIPDLDWGAVLGGAIDLASKFGDWVVNDIPWDTIITGIGDLASKFGDWVVNDVPWKDIITGIGDLASKFGDWVVNDVPWKDIITGIGDLASKFGDWVINDIPWKDIISDVGDVASKFGDWVINDIPWKDIVGAGVDIASKFGDWVINDIPWKDIVGTGLDIASKFTDWVVNDVPWASLVDGYLDIWSKFADWTVNDIPWSSLVNGYLDIWSKFADWTVNDIPWSSLVSGSLDLGAKFVDWTINDVPWTSIITGTWDASVSLGQAVQGLGDKIVSALGIPKVTGDFDIKMPSVEDILNYLFGEGGQSTPTSSSRGSGGAMGGMSGAPIQPLGNLDAIKAMGAQHGQQTTVTTTFQQVGGEAVAAVAAAVSAAVGAVPTSWVTTLMQAGGETVAAVSNAATAAINAIPTSHLTAIVQAGAEAVAGAANAAAAAINGIPTSHNTTLTAVDAGATAVASSVAAAIAAIPSSKTITISTVGGAARAIGGYVTGGLTRLAELGPELVAMPNGDWFMAMRDALYPTPLGSYVYTAGQTSSMVGALAPVPAYAGGGYVGGRRGGGSGGGDINVTFTGNFYGSNRAELNEWAARDLLPQIAEQAETRRRTMGGRR